MGFTLTGQQIETPTSEDDMVVIRGCGARQITYRIWAHKLRIQDNKLKLNVKVVVDELTGSQRGTLVGFGVTEENREPTIVWKSATFETSYFGMNEEVVGKTYNDTFGVSRISRVVGVNDQGDSREMESPHVYTIAAWCGRSKLAPWIIVHLASGLCIACVTSENVAKAKVEDAFEDRRLRDSVALQISQFVEEEAGKLA